MLTVSQVSKSHGGRVLFEDVSLQVNRGDRIGLIGANGVGKSTLFSLLLDEQTPDAGSIAFQRGVKIGFLPQETAPCGEETILELATSVSREMKEVRRLIHEPSSQSFTMDHEAHDRFAEMDGYKLEARARRILTGLAFRQEDHNLPARTLSGGWVMRAHLARLLVMEPDLLLLDEPTNHLDLESLEWFQRHLCGYRGAILTISHDREFLNVVCREIVEISRARVHRYDGNFDDYLAQKAAREEQYAAAYRNQQREIQNLQRFIERFRSKASKASQAQDKIKQLERMERLAPPESSDATVRFYFPQPNRSGQRVMILKGVTQGYGDLIVYRDLDLILERGQRIVLVGPNGAGKSTLLKIFAGLTPLRSGIREPGYSVKIAYFTQHRIEMLDEKRTVLEEAMAVANPVSEQKTRTVLGSFLFRGDDVFKTVGVLSGGEKSRLALVKILLDPPNLLLLDEPTTHLDMSSIDALVRALDQYTGTLVFVSHDVHFIRSVATTVLHVQAGEVMAYPGGYDYFVEKTQATSSREALVAPLANAQLRGIATHGVSRSGPGLKEIRTRRKAEAEARKMVNREKRDREKRVKELENEILRFEEKQKRLAAELEDPETYSDPSRALELNRELEGVVETLERVNAEWEVAVEAVQAGR